MDLAMMVLMGLQASYNIENLKNPKNWTIEV